jgi:hypothetical protein
MTEIKISDEDVELVLTVLPAGPWRHYDDYHKDALPHREAVARKILDALVASGWRREEDVLREAAVVLRHHSTFFDDENEYGRGMWAASEVLEAHVDHPVSLRQRATEAEQYVSAGTREGEDQKRDEEQQGA